jgi:hypothetical protein
LEECADGLTVADHDTGLLWEVKTGTFDVALPASGFCETAGCPDAHDVNNRYAWSIVSPDPNGNAFTDFLAKLNDSSQPATWSSGSPASIGTQLGGCFADHCNWRLPTIAELLTIFDSCSPVLNICIDPVFGPSTGSSAVWSATELPDPTSSTQAWAAFEVLSGVFVGAIQSAKEGSRFVRAVRAGSCEH